MSTFPRQVPLLGNSNPMNRLEDYIEDKRFIKWVFDPDEETNRYFEDYLKEHPGQSEKILGMKKELRLLSMPESKISFGRGMQLFQSILFRLHAVKKREARVRYLETFFRYAAVALVFLVIGSVLVYYHPARNRIDMRLTEDLLLKNAWDCPVLYFADGSKKEITSQKRLIDLSQPGKCVIGNDTIVQKDFREATLFSNVLVVPNGQRLQVRLADRSTIWINAGSRLIFPPAFDAHKREVYLAGEAFFEITGNPAQPFIVNTSTVAIKVLGTKFNVSSYPEDHEVVTVLQEGRVQILDTKTSFLQQIVKAELKPNQMARFNKDSEQLDVVNTDYRLYTLWNEGILRFQQQQIDQMILKVERYYNVRIILKNPEKGKEKITGKLDLNEGIPGVLEYISKITNSEIKQMNINNYILE